MSEDQGSVKSEDSLSGRAKFLCSYGGRIMPRPHDSQLRYVGGETRILSVHRNIPYLDLMNKLKKICPYENVILKYQLPDEDLDALVSVISDEDLDNMMEEYDKIEAADSNSRLRLFLFPAKSPESPNNSNNASTSTESKFVEALNGVYRKPNLVPLEEQKRVVLVPATAQAVPQVVQVVPPPVQSAVAVQPVQQTPVKPTVQATVHALPAVQAATPVAQPRTVQPTVPAAAAVPSIHAVPAPTLPTVQPAVQPVMPPVVQPALSTVPPTVPVHAVPPPTLPTVQPTVQPAVQPALPAVPTVPTVPSALSVMPVVPQTASNVYGGAAQVTSFVPATQKVVRVANPIAVSGRPQVLRTAYVPFVGGVPKVVLRVEDERSEQSMSSQNSQVTEPMETFVCEPPGTELERLKLENSKGMYVPDVKVCKGIDTHLERYLLEQTPGIPRAASAPALQAPVDIPLVGQVVSQLNRQFTGDRAEPQLIESPTPNVIVEERFGKQAPTVLQPLNGMKTPVMGTEQVGHVLDGQLMHKGMNVVAMNQFKVP